MKALLTVTTVILMTSFSLESVVALTCSKCFHVNYDNIVVKMNDTLMTEQQISRLLATLQIVAGDFTIDEGDALCSSPGTETCGAEEVCGSALITSRQEMSNGTTTLTVSGVKVSTKECIAADNTCQTFSDGLMEQRYNHTKSENTKSTRSFTMTECELSKCDEDGKNCDVLDKSSAAVFSSIPLTLLIPLSFAHFGGI